LCFNSNAPSYYRVVAGTLKTANPGSTHTVTKITNNAWNSNTNENDISIWKISPSFTFNTNTKAVGLPAQGASSSAGTVMTVSGWGTTSVSY
jgi:Trypsin